MPADAQSVRRILARISEFDRPVGMLLHAGDYVFSEVYHILQQEFNGEFRGVYGNDDPQELKSTLPMIVIVELPGIKLTVAHRYSDAMKVSDSDAYVFGHFHFPQVIHTKAALEMRPGSPCVPRNNQQETFGILTLDSSNRSLHAEIVKCWNYVQ